MNRSSVAPTPSRLRTLAIAWRWFGPCASPNYEGEYLPTRGGNTCADCAAHIYHDTSGELLKMLFGILFQDTSRLALIVRAQEVSQILALGRPICSRSETKSLEVDRHSSVTLYGSKGWSAREPITISWGRLAVPMGRSP